MRKAVVDVGSNSVLLLVERRDGGRWRTIAEGSEITALGEGVKASRMLGEPGIDATLAALRRFFDEAGTDDVGAYATMAARLAENTPNFLMRAAAQGTPVSVLSGEDEARLGFEAVAYDRHFKDCPRISIIDVGGQSTEITTGEHVGEDWRIVFGKSFPIGTLALRGSTLEREAPSPGALVKAAAEVDAIIGMDFQPGRAGRAVVLGAAGTNLVSLRERYETWEPDKIHGAILTFEEISRMVENLSELTDEERRVLPGLEPGRQRTIHIGALILERVMNAIGVSECAVSVRGWRHALLERGLK